MRKNTHKDAQLRKQILKRDAGICKFCNTNTVLLRKQFAFKTIFDDGWPIGFDEHRRSWWDVHHVVAICAGGDQYNPENCITLCIKCHKKETKRLAAWRAIK